MLISLLKEKLAVAFQKAFPNAPLSCLSYLEMTPATHPRFGHYQCNGAMKMTKLLELAPRDIALQIKEELQKDTLCFEKCEVAGPGFINLTLTASFISDICQTRLTTTQQEQPLLHQKVIVDYSSPNVAKEMHVGHLRSTIIGECLARVFEKLGAQVLRLNHIGDWGTAFGMLIAYLQQIAPIEFTEEKMSIAFLVQCYKEAKKKFDEEPQFKKEAQLMVVALQKGDEKARQLWEKICSISRQAYQEIYDLLEVKIIERGESFYNPFLPEIIQKLEYKNMITVSEGAKCVFLEGFANREGEALPFIVQKSDGGYNYAATDLAALSHRIEVEKADRIVYVTDAGQAMHFAMLFAAARKAGIALEKNRLDHVPFGLVLGPDGKKFKTRSGEVERLIDLLNAAIEKAQTILLDKHAQDKDFSPEEIKAIARVLGINAVKYADLSSQRLNDYVFSYDRMLQFEGNTAAFLMYAFVRIQGIQRRIGDKGAVEAIALAHPSEIALGLHLSQFQEVLYSIADDLLPHRLCEYLYHLAEKFNAFFRDCRVEGSKEQGARLALCELSAKVLEEGLRLLGLKTVSRM